MLFVSELLDFFRRQFVIVTLGVCGLGYFDLEDPVDIYSRAAVIIIIFIRLK